MDDCTTLLAGAASFLAVDGAGAASFLAGAGAASFLAGAGAGAASRIERDMLA